MLVKDSHHCPLRKSDWESFDDFQRAWHAMIIPKPSKDSMYWDGQFDELPFDEWEELPE